MRLFKVGPQSHLSTFFGLGASYQDGGRWNRPGIPALYFGATASVSMLEMANYLTSPRLVPPSYRLAVYELPDRVPCQTLSLHDMPKDWREFPYPTSTQTIGSDWLLSGAGVLLFVPSATVPGGLENIALFNPQHPDARRIRLVDAMERIYSPRMFVGGDDK